MRKLGNRWDDKSPYNNVRNFMNAVDHIYSAEFLEKLFELEVNITP